MKTETSKTITAEKKTDKTNVQAAKQKVQYERVLKWKYPEECTSAGARKTFRAKHRAEIRRLEARALKHEGAEREKLQKEANTLRKKVLMDPQAAL